MGKDFIVTNIDELNMFVRTGTVIDHQQSVHSSTTVTTSGGGGFLHQGSGYVHAPTTTTSTSSEEKLRIFLRRDDGTETEVEFWDAPFGVREGHRVSVVYAGPKAANKGVAVALINHSTDNDELFLHRLDSMLPKMSGCLALSLILGTPVLFVLLGALVFGSAAGVGMLGLIAGFAIVITKLSKRKNLANAVATEIRAKVSEVIEQQKTTSYAA